MYVNNILFSEYFDSNSFDSMCQDLLKIRSFCQQNTYYVDNRVNGILPCLFGAAGMEYC
jgi:hypothetical protein